MYKVSVTPVVGLPQFTGWSQVLTQSSDEGELVVALAVAGEHAGNVGRDLAELVRTTVVQDALSLNHLFQNLILQAQGMDAALQMAAGYFFDGRVILGVHRATIFLKRGEKNGKVLTSAKDTQIVEGKYLTSDVVILTTEQATSYLDEVAQKFSRGFELDSVIASLIPGLHAEEDSSLSALGFVTGGQVITLEEVPLAADWSEVERDMEEVSLLEEASDEVVTAEPEKTEELDELNQSTEPVIGVINEQQLAGVPDESVVSDTASVLVETADSGTTEATPPSRISRQWWLNLRHQGELVQSRLAGNRSSAETLAAVASTQVKTGSAAVAAQLKIWLASVFSLCIRVIAKIPRLVGALTGLLRRLRRTSPQVSQWQAQVGGADVYLTPRSPRQFLRVALPLSLVLLVVAGGGGYLVYRTQSQVQAAEIALQPLQSKLDSAQAQAATDPIPARETVMSVISELEVLKQNYQGKKPAMKLVESQLASARRLYDDISGKEEFSELAIFYDATLISSGFVIGPADSNGRFAVFLDAGKKAAIILNLASKEAKQVSLEVESLKDVAVTENNAHFLGDGIRRVSLTKDEPIQTIIAEGDSNRDATIFEAFGEYLYLFNPEKRNIFRYAPDGERFSDPIGWLRGVTGLEMNTVTSLSIDGDLWLGTNDGKILKYAGGRPQEFAVRGLSELFKGKIVLFTKEDLKNLYVLEADQRRLVVLTKKGEFLREIKSTSLASATTLVVSEELGKALLISGSIVFEVGL